jgi:NADH-quinone oxidoreductase subunit N
LVVAIVLAEAFGMAGFALPVAILYLFASTGYALVTLPAPEPEWFTTFFDGMLQSDTTGRALSATLLFVAGCWMLGHYRSLSTGPAQSERVALALASLVGGIVVCRFQNLLCLYLGIELLSIPLYVLTGANKRDPNSYEASLKYFLLSAFFSAFRLLGIVLFYGATGSFDLGASVPPFGTDTGGLDRGALLGAAVLLLVASGLFKLSAVPFHFWAADVYDGAPTPIAALLTTIGKLAGAAALLRCIDTVAFSELSDVWSGPLGFALVATLVFATLVAAVQGSVRRRLAYASIANSGFLLMGIGTRDLSAVVVFGAAYAVGTLLVFAVLDRLDGSDLELDGLARRRPALALLLALGLGSLAGVPPLPGFFGKYLALSAAFEGRHFAWVAAGVFGSVISAAYYLEIVVRMLFREPSKTELPAGAATT